MIVTGYPRTKTTGADWDVPKTGDAAEPDIYPVVGNYTRSTTLWTSTDVLFDANKYILFPFG